jgi:hypothetical protein
MRRDSSARILLALAALSGLCVGALSIVADGPDYGAGSLTKLEAQSIYAADPHDAWNRIFYLLFTRTVEVRLTDDFKGVGPYESIDNVMGHPSLTVTSRRFERIESGDRAIDPLYPNFFNAAGAESVLADPQFTELKRALTEACAETTLRPPLQRALMQSDAWAAYDVLNWMRRIHGPTSDRAREILPLLAQFIGKLALSSEEIAALPDNCAAARKRLNLPDVFNPASGFVEVEWFPQRLHDFTVNNRRAARVFLKPETAADRFLSDTNARIRKHEDPLPDGLRSLEGAALTTQMLLIDRKGRVVPSPLMYELQFRTSVRDARGAFKTAAVEEYDLSRKALLADASSGGLIRHGDDDPAYLPSSGNDFTFASPTIGQQEAGPPILATLRRRCESCHFEATVNTFMMMQDPRRASPPLRQLQSASNERGLYVAGAKMKESRFNELLGDMRLGKP